MSRSSHFPESFTLPRRFSLPRNFLWSRRLPIAPEDPIVLKAYPLPKGISGLEVFHMSRSSFQKVSPCQEGFLVQKFPYSRKFTACQEGFPCPLVQKFSPCPVYEGFLVHKFPIYRKVSRLPRRFPCPEIYPSSEVFPLSRSSFQKVYRWPRRFSLSPSSKVFPMSSVEGFLVQKFPIYQKVSHLPRRFPLSRDLS